MREQLLARHRAVSDRLEATEWEGLSPRDAEISVMLHRLIKAEHTLDSDGPAQVGLFGIAYEDELAVIEAAEELAQRKGL